MAIMAIDQGTTSSRAIIFDVDGVPLAMDQQELLKKLPEIKNEGDYLTLILYDRKFGIHCETGKIVTAADFQPAEIISTPSLIDPVKR